MVRYPIARDELIRRIQDFNPGWLAKAQARTAQYAEAQDYTGGTEFWGRIKQVYIELQHEKCAYCETRLQGAEYASKVHEVEHFRPKSSVKTWPDRNRAAWKAFPADIAAGGASAKGYYQLAYHPFNYAIACTRCNSSLKANHFPVRGTRDVALADPSWGHGEDPLLVYPVSDIDSDPADLIAFDGVLAVPNHTTGQDFERALATIFFFDLNHQDLTSRRAEMMAMLWSTLESERLAQSAAERSYARETLALTFGEGGQFSACMKAFRALYAQDRAQALEKAKLARALGQKPTP
jgi:hypothetical protein